MDKMGSIIHRVIATVGRAIILPIFQKWNQEVGSAASNFSSVLLNGGGAYYFEQPIRGFISLVDLPEETNPRGYLDLALILEDVRATAWDRT
jgi:hypothetical protein